MLKIEFRAILLCVICLLTLQNAYAQQAEKPLKPVRLQLIWKHQFQFAGFYAAKQQGFYQDAGLDVEIIPFSKDGASPVEKVTSGAAEFGIGDSSIIVDRAKGKPLKLLANIFQHDPLVLLTLSESGIFSPSQMIGKKIMLARHEIANPVFNAMLATESTSLDQMQVVDHSFSIDQLINGEVDVMSVYATNQPALLQNLGIRYNIIDPKNYGIDFYGNNIFTHENFLSENQALVKDFVDASLKGWEYALQNPDQIIDLILQQYSKEKSRSALEFEARATHQYILPEHILLGEINRDRIQRIVQIYQNQKLIPAEFDLESLLHNSQKNINNPLQLSVKEKQWIKEKKYLTIGVEPSWAPFEYFDKEGNYSGMASEYIRLISEKTGLSIRVQNNSSWQDAIKSARAGELDILPAVVKSPSTREYLDFTTPHMSYPMVIVTTKNSGFISNMNDLDNKQVIVVKGHVSEEILRLNHPNFRLVLVQNMNQALEMLSSGDADAFIDNLASITYSITQQGYTNLRISGKTPYDFQLSIGVVKGQSILVDILQKTIDSITDKEKKAIRGKWISVTLPQETDYKLIIEIGLILTLVVAIILFWNRKLALEIGRRRRFERELIKSAQRFRELFENNKAVELIVDPVSDKIVAANNAAIQYYGYSFSEIQQMSIMEINILSTEEIAQEIKLAQDQHRPHFYFKHKLASGEIRDVEVHSGPIDWSGQQLRYSIIHDITDRVKAEKALIVAKAEAETATRIKSQFLANMSHEIRTPMNSVLGMAELLQQTPLNEEQKKMLSIVQNSGKALISIINDILDFSKLEADKMDIEYVQFQLLPFLQEIIDTFIIQAKEKNIVLLADFSSDSDVEIESDPTRLRQVLTNLISNAIKFTEAGSVTVSVKLNETDSASGEVVFQIIDTGIGLQKNQITHLFDSFTQAEQSTTRKFGGTGLGLTISKKLLELLDGNIQVSSIQGQGSTFTVELPVKYNVLSERQKKQRLTSIKSRENVSLQFKANILIAEDVVPNRILIEKMMAKFGLGCQFAENGQQALNMARSFAYDLILMDCQMPIMDGYTATRKIREFDKNIPILALTANATTEDSERALAAGMNEILTKPIQLNILEKALQHWLNQYKSDKVQQLKRAKNTGGDNLPVINFGTLKRLKADMEEAFEEVYQSIFSSIQSSLEELQDCPDNNQTITRLFHSIKSPAASVGAEKLAALAADYEQQARSESISDLRPLVENLKKNFTDVQIQLTNCRISD